MRRFKKILIANRGEIALRVIRAAREIGLRSVAIFHEEDREALHTKEADEAYLLPGTALQETYLNGEKIVELALRTDCQLVHPGYGFLAENSDFASACEEAGLVFVGPSPSAIALMGDKQKAREFVNSIDVPLLHAWQGTPEELIEKREDLFYPILIKAAAGGGGKGMRVVHHPEQLNEAVHATAREARNYFGNPSIYLEPWVERARHIEVQVLGDQHGNLVHLYERECSLQRRHQKVVEECPSPSLSDSIRQKIFSTALRIAKAANYYSAGTVEFLMDEQANFYFLEMNTRIQVEHPVTEMATGMDLVREQLRIASGLPLSFTQEEIRLQGHAIEARIYAEDPLEDFRPSPGRMSLFLPPMTGVRLESAYNAAGTISSAFDPMISKLIVHGSNRTVAISRMQTALDDFSIHGVRTNLEYLRYILASNSYGLNLLHTRSLEQNLTKAKTHLRDKKDKTPKDALLAAYLFLKGKGNGNAVDPWQNLGGWRLLRQESIVLDESVYHLFPTEKEKGLTFELEGEIVTAEMLYWGENQIRMKVQDRICTIIYSKDGPMCVSLELDGVVFGIQDQLAERVKTIREQKRNQKQHSESQKEIIAPLPGKVVEMKVKPGLEFKKGDILCVIEAMKMENNILATADGVVEKIFVNPGDQVESRSPLLLLT